MIRVSQILRCYAFLVRCFEERPEFVTRTKDATNISSEERAQRMASVMARHARLPQLLYVVKIGRMNPAEGGRIELAYGQKVVFIDVSDAAGRFDPSLQAVLAHELAHKVLFDAGVLQGSATRLEYEVLTDITAIYCGFGKLLLNGYEYKATRRSRHALATETVTRRFGYLSREEVAFVLLFQYCRHGHPTSKWHDGLSPNSIRLLEDCHRRLDLAHHYGRAKRLAPALQFH